MIGPRPKLVTFDCYGTLVDWAAGIRAYLGEILAHKNAEVDLETFYGRWYGRQLKEISGPFKPYREVLRDSLQTALRDFGLPAGPDDGTDFGTAMEGWEPFPESVGVLAKLKARYALAVVSNSQRDIISCAVEKLGSPFEHVVTAEDVRAYKPDPRPFERALKLGGATPEETLHVARSQDVDLPRSVPMGIRTAWINRAGEPLRPGVPEPDHELPDLRPLLGLLGLDP